MEERELGRSGLRVSAQGYGAMGISQFYGLGDEEEGLATIRRALDLGITLIDTAEAYGPFTNEQVVGRAIAGRRDEVVLSSKTGFRFDDEGNWFGIDGTPANIHHAIDRSLRHLNVDHLDLYYLHRLDPNVAVEESVGAMADLVAAGKIKYIGLSEVSAATMRRACAVHPISALQTEYSLFARDVEVNGVLDATIELGIGFVAYSPLGRGILSGRISSSTVFEQDDWRLHDPRFTQENLQHNLDLVEAISAFGAAREMTPSQVALTWLQDVGTVAIPGTKRRVYLEENAAATSFSFSATDLAELDLLVPFGAVAGERYSASRMRAIDA